MGLKLDTNPRLFPSALLILGIGLSLSGCGSFHLQTAYDYQGHYIAIHKDGVAIKTPSYEEAAQNPSGSVETELIHANEADFEHQIQDTIINRITAHANSLAISKHPDCDGRLHLLIIVHGGMNNYSSSSQHVTDLMPSPISLPNTPVGTYPKQGLLNSSCYYPLFINWNSSFGEAISDDLFRLRFGDHNPPLAISTSPIVLGNRVLSSAMTVPTALFHQGVTMVDGIKGASQEGDPLLGIIGDTLLNLPAYAISMVVLPFTEGIGSPAWGIMKRRVDDATGSIAPAVKTRPDGAARTLIQALRNSIVAKTDCGNTQHPNRGPDKYCWADTPTEVTVTMVGHSMGALVINRLLEVSEDTSQAVGRPAFPIDRIIYLAPACSINEAEQLLMPYLDRHPDTHFWLFTLNKRDESREIPFEGWAVFVPRGTLLAWIDTFLEKEAGPGEGRLGWVKYLEEFYGISDEPQKARRLLEYFTQAEEPFRRLNVNWAPSTNSGRLHAYSSQRRISDHKTAPEYHHDFLTPEHFKTVLCTVDSRMFTSDKTCHP